MTCWHKRLNNSSNTQIQGDGEREESRRLSLDDKRPPAVIDGYTMIRRLGTGAYGTVWQAREDNTGRMVAVKYYSFRRGLNWSLLTREVEKLATLYTSRNIVQLLDVGWNAEPPYYVMEFVENGSLSTFMLRGPLAVNEAVRLASEVCHALIEAHGAGVLHCDLKPENVLLDSSFKVRLCDFGQSRMSHERSPALGTLYYMAPEQADLEAVADARWDVYAVGALLYHMVTGQPPFRTQKLQQKLESTESLKDRLAVYRDAIKISPPPAAHRSVRGVDKRLAQLIDSCLATDPGKRLPNAQSILAELEGREHQRARRPLLLLGVLGPLLLIAAMVPLFVNALQDAVDEMERGLTARALESDAESARALAGALEGELIRRLADLQNVLKNRDLVEQLEVLAKRPVVDVVEEMKHEYGKPLSARSSWIRSLDQAREDADKINLQAGQETDTSWFLTDRDGNQIWRRDYSEITIGKNYNWRDYFHGRNMEYDRLVVPSDISPIELPHMSLPFKSRATGKYMISLSVPVRSSSKEIIGVLARTVHLDDLRNRLGHYVRESNQRGLDGDAVSRKIVLADFRSGALLDHPWLDTCSQEEREAVFDRLVLPASVLKKLKTVRDTLERSDDRLPMASPVEALLPVYTDPVGTLAEESAESYRGEWMAAMALMQQSKTPWVVIVQEQRESMLRPVGDMKRKAARTAWVSVATSILLMGIVWIFVGRAISRSNA